MSEVPVQYAPTLPLPKEAVCAGCGSSNMLVRDHCHEHGWLRGIVCVSCNAYLGRIDARLAPGVSDEFLCALLAVRNNCSECTPLDPAALERRLRPEALPPKPATYSVDPTIRKNRLRRKAARQGYKLLKARRGPDVRLIPAKGNPKIFPSMDAVEDFLNGRC